MSEDMTPEEAKQILTWYEAYPAMPTDVEVSIVSKLKAVIEPEPEVSVGLTVSQIDRILRWYGESSDLEDEDDDLRDDNLATMLSVARKLAE